MLYISGMIEIEKKGKNNFRFKLKTQSGHTLLKSVAYKNETEIQDTVQYLNTPQQNKIRFERKTNNEGFFLFDIKKSDGQLIGHSQCYTSEAGMENGINNLIHRMDSLTPLDDL